MAFLNSVEKLVATVTAALEGPVVPAVVGIAKNVVDLLESSKEVVNSTDAQALQAKLDELAPKVQAHADLTESELRGS